VIVPYVESVHQELQAPQQAAMAIFDNFEDRITKKVLVKKKHNCTDMYQPMDLSVNKTIKAFCENNSQLGIPKKFCNKYTMTMKLYSLLNKFRNTNQKKITSKNIESSSEKSEETCRSDSSDDDDDSIS